MSGSLKKAISRWFSGLMLSGLALVTLLGGAGCNGAFPLNPGQGGDPTEFSGIVGCATSYSDSDYNYGFNVPADAELVRTKNESNSLTNSLWTFTQSGALINVITRVEPTSSDADLGTLVSFANDLSVSAGADLLSEEQLPLSNGGTGIETIIRFDGLTTFRVQALAGARLYTVEAVIEESARNSESDSALSDIVVSLCLGS